MKSFELERFLYIGVYTAFVRKLVGLFGIQFDFNLKPMVTCQYKKEVTNFSSFFFSFYFLFFFALLYFFFFYFFSFLKQLLKSIMRTTWQRGEAQNRNYYFSDG